MTLFKNKYRIESARLKGWDYSADGYYFITICTKNREHFFGEIVDGKMVLSEIGKMAEQYWIEIPNHFPFVRLNEFVVMPNHMHGILINNAGNAGNAGRDAINRVSTGVTGVKNDTDAENGGITKNHNPMLNPYSISRIIRWYKGRVTFEINQLQNEIKFAWQPRFHDHVIRNSDELNRIRNYIKNNPVYWHTDDYNQQSQEAS